MIGMYASGVWLMSTTGKNDWVVGDALGREIPAHSEALRAGGEAFLTEAFRAAGSISAGNSIARITGFEEVFGGSTGRKLLLSVEYDKPAPDLHRDLFVKFSRDFDDDLRDRARTQMELEVLFALLSRSPNFPIVVPRCYFSDFHHQSGTGILITERIPYDRGGVEPHYPKCLDYRMPNQLEHYRALVTALARLAGSHKAGLLPGTVEDFFPFDPAKLTVSLRASYTPDQISDRVRQFAGFAGQYPQLLPDNILSGEFIARLATEAPRFQAMESLATGILQSKADMIALCHWNAHVDNAWFWRNSEGEMECGLMDWGNVSQMNVAMAIWGCLSAAELFIWNDHLDDLLELFVAEFSHSGGSALDPAELKRHMVIYVAMMGLAWMLDAPQLILKKVPDLAQAKDRLDPRIQSNERARSQLLIMSAFLNLWEKEDMSALMDYMEKTAG